MNIATIGTGSIVDTFLAAAEQVTGIVPVAMYSRKESTAIPLAQKYDIPKIYTDLNALVSDSSIDFIYVASPNSLHFEHTLLALQHGKHVICEKPFTSTVAELELLIHYAKQNKLMLFEAITTIHLPNYKLIKEQLNQLGPIKFIQCNISQYSRKYNDFLAGETPNVFNPKFSGGALYDINIYNIHFVLNLFGKPSHISYTANKHANGIDTSGIAVLTYPEFIAECVGCKDTRSMNFVLIQGEKGYIHVLNGANGCEKILVHLGNEVHQLNEQNNPNWWYYELANFQQIFENKDYDTCYDLLAYSRNVIETLVAARQSAGILFEADSIIRTLK
jgi:predicted dehydrogenase